MTGSPRAVRLSGARIHFVDGSPIEHLSEALYAAVNSRGIMASGLAGAIRLAAGAEVERELRAIPNLLLGQAYLVRPGRLARRGVRYIACGVTTLQPGQPPRRTAVEDALSVAFELLRIANARSLTLPEIGLRVPNIDIADAAGILTAALASALRRGLRLDTVTIASLHPAYLRACQEQLLRAGAFVES
jgi:O-acetyl-ADP-ribose deacetylase (regulator of RNase III)